MSRQKNQQILNQLTHLQKQIDVIKKQLFLQHEKYEIIAIHRDGFSFVGVNDHLNNGDRVMICTTEEVDKDLIKRGIQGYLNRLNPTHEGIVVIHSDIPSEDLDENYRKFLEVLDIEYTSVDDDLVELLRGEYVKDNSREEQ